jgi:hypothetical protein
MPTPAPSSEASSSSSNVQSTNNKTNEESSKETNKETTTVEKSTRPPSAQKTTADISKASVTATTGENVSPTYTSHERPPSANKQPAATTTTETRPGSAAKNSSQDTVNRPSSAAKVDPTVTPSLDATTDAKTSSRPPSANKKPEDTTASSTTIGHQDTSAPIDPNDPNIAKPIIGRPSSGGKKESTEGLTTIAKLVAATPLNPLPANTSSSDHNK